jgi:hypothetical protein
MEYSIGSGATVLAGHYFQEGKIQQVKLINSPVNEEIGLLSTSKIFCHVCRSDSTIFASGETICSSCAIIISDKQAACTRKKSQSGLVEALLYIIVLWN